MSVKGAHNSYCKETPDTIIVRFYSLQPVPFHRLTWLYADGRAGTSVAVVNTLMLDNFKGGNERA